MVSSRGTTHAIRVQRSQVGLHSFPRLHLCEEALGQAEALVQGQGEDLRLLLDLLPGQDHHLLLGRLQEHGRRLLKLLQVLMWGEHHLVLLLRLWVMMRHVEVRGHADLADLHVGAVAELRVAIGGRGMLVVVLLVVVVVVEEEARRVVPIVGTSSSSSSALELARAPPPARQTRPPRGLQRRLHLAPQGPQRRVEVQVLEGAPAAQHVVEHGRQVQVPAQDVSAPAQDVSAPAQDVSAPTQDVSAPTQDVSAPAVRLVGQQGGCGRGLGFAHGRVFPPPAASLVKAAMLYPAGRRVPSVFGEPVSAASRGGVAVAVGRHPAALEDAVDEHVAALRVQLPEAALPRLVLPPRNLPEALVEGQVVADGVLEEEQEDLVVLVVRCSSTSS